MRQMILLFLVCSLLLCISFANASPPSPEIELQIRQGLITEPVEFTRQTDFGEPTEMIKDLVRGNLRTTYNIVVIPFEYADYPAVTDPTYLDSLFFGDYFGTVRDYYSEITNGGLTLTTLNLPSEIGWLTLSGNLEDYNGRPPTDEIMTLADPFIDFSQYDNDGDGVVNSVILLHAGCGYESGCGSLQIWSHCGGFHPNLELDGVHFWKYSAVPEYSHSPRDQVIGVICHELGHQIMRWGDLYIDSGPNGPRYYCIMAFGCWNGSPSGTMPSHPNLYYKLKNGLLDSQWITEDVQNMQFPEVLSYPIIPKLWMNGMDFYEYFIVENRQRTGYDSAIPEDGLLVYHIDMGEREPGIQRRSIALVPAGQIDGQTKYPYPGYTYDNRTLDSTSTPDSRDYNGNNTFVALRNISNSSLTMSADVYVENPIPPTVSITSPELGMSWLTGDTNRILWNSSGVYHDQKIEVRREGGPWEVLTDSVENKGYFDWVTDYPTANTANIRVSDAYTPEIQDVSDDFSIIPPTLTITYPAATMTWRVGDLVHILWESTGMDVSEDVSIEIQRDGGRWEMLTNDCANTGSYSWEVTRPITRIGAYVRITSIDDPLVADTSARVRIGERTLNLTYPNAFDYFAIHDPVRIEWEVNGFTDPSVDIELTRNFGVRPTVWESIAENVPTEDLHYDWQVSGALSAQARIRLKGHTQTTVADTSYEDFTICDAHGLSIFAPNGEEYWRTPESFEICWTSDNLLPTEPIRIELTRNYDPLMHLVWETLVDSTLNTGSWLWEVTPPESRTARIRISSVRHYNIISMSRRDFTVGVRSITVQVPNGGETWMPGDTVTISWGTQDMDPHDGYLGVFIHRTEPGNPESGWRTISKFAQIDQPYVWVVNELTATDALIAVQSMEYPSIADTSDDYFCVGDFTVQVTSPNGGEQWIVNEEREITWITDIPDECVKIEINRRYPEGDWEIIETEAHNTGSYMWTVDGRATDSARIRVSSQYAGNVSDISDASFSIAEYGLDVLTPAGGELWWLGEIYDITWSALNFTAGDSLRVDIYRGRGGSMWEEVAIVPALDYCYPWKVTGWYSSVVKVRLTSLLHPEIADTSADFTTNFPVITLTSPNGWETLTIGHVHRIEWTQNYNPEADSIGLSISRNHPYGGWETLVENMPNTGFYDWTVTGPPADSARVEIFSTVMYWPKDISDTIFTIEGTIRVLEPNERTVWNVGRTVDIVWDGDLSDPLSHIMPEDVIIELSRDYSDERLQRWELIAARVPHYGTYSWRVTGPGTRNARIRITKSEQRNNYALSEGTFSILELFSFFRTDNPTKLDPDATVFQFGPLTPPVELRSIAINNSDALSVNTRITLARQLHEDGTIDCIYDYTLKAEDITTAGCSIQFSENNIPTVGTTSSYLYVFVSHPGNRTERRTTTTDNVSRSIDLEDVAIQAVFAGSTELTLTVIDNNVKLNWSGNGTPAFDIYRSKSPDTPGELIATVNDPEYSDNGILGSNELVGFYRVIPRSQTIVPSGRLENGDTRQNKK